MTDLLLTLGTNKRARSVLGALKLPIPLPEPLTRADGAWSARPLEGGRGGQAAGDETTKGAGVSEGVLCPIHQTPMIFTHVADDDTEIYFCEACDAMPRTAWNAITKAFEEDCWQEIIPVKPDT